VVVHENIHHYGNNYSGTSSHIEGQTFMHNNSVTGHVRGQGKQWTGQSPPTAEVLTEERASGSGGRKAYILQR